MEGKVAIVTGGSKGIGAAIARQLAGEGARVAVNYASSEADAQRVVGDIREAGGTAIAVGADVSTEDDCARLVDECVDQLGGVHILVNNAAHFRFGPIETLDTAGFRDHFEVNVLGTILMTRSALPHLREGSAIINVGSAGIVTPGPNAVLYAGSKAALEKVTQFMASELGPRGIRVNCVRPGATDTEGNRRVGTLDNQEMVDLLVAKTALGRFGRPEDVAPVVAFLASEQAHWVTGAIVDASGGFA